MMSSVHGKSKPFMNKVAMLWIHIPLLAIRLCVNMLGRTKNMYVYCYLRQVLINLRQAYIKRYLKRVIWTNLRVWRNLKEKAIRYHDVIKKDAMREYVKNKTKEILL